MEFRADLHMHPHFYSPQSGKRVPSLKQIINHIFGAQLDICAISACHAAPGHQDRRFHDYVNQLIYLEGDFETNYHGKEGFLHLKRRIPLCMEVPEVLILNSQEVRTDYKGMPADINVIGVYDFIKAGKDIDETVRIARDKGGIVTICHPGSQCGAGLEKAMELINSGKVHAIEGYDATEARHINKRVTRELTMKGIKALAVSDAHHYTQMGAAHTMLDLECSLGDFKIENLGYTLDNDLFKPVEGQVGFFSKHYYHTLPILMSIPRHMLSTPRQFVRTILRR